MSPVTTLAMGWHREPRMGHVHVIHENAEWSAPLFAALDDLGLPWRDWHLEHGRLRLDEAPPEGVFYNRMSASSHTRGHRYSPELTAALLDWLEGHDAHVLNGSSALRLELSKVAQYTALERFGIRTPRTAATLGATDLVAAADEFEGAFITKHNRAGKGLGVRLFKSANQLARHVESDEFEPSVDGITLVQQYIQAPTPHITRVEFIGRRLLYAVRVDTSGGFELCPADACSIGDAFCPAGASVALKFEVVPSFRHPLVERYQRFMASAGIDVAAFEFIEDSDGVAWTYDVNTNTNYNDEAEARAGIRGMERLARHLGAELARHDANNSLPREAVA